MIYSEATLPVFFASSITKLPISFSFSEILFLNKSISDLTSLKTVSTLALLLLKAFITDSILQFLILSITKFSTKGPLRFLQLQPSTPRDLLVPHT